MLRKSTSLILSRGRLFSRSSLPVSHHSLTGNQNAFRHRLFVVPSIIDMTDELNKAQENKALDSEDKNALEELLNEPALINTLYPKENLEKVITEIAISISTSSNLNKDHLRENIKKLFDRSREENTPAFKL